MPHAKALAAQFELDLGRYELRRSGFRLKLEKKPMELLIFLVSRRDQLVSRQDIVSRLWRSDPQVDTERNINNIVRKIRSALSDNSEEPVFLETVIGKGYRFIGPLRVIHARFPSFESPTEISSRKSSKSPSALRAERAALVVLPLIPLGSIAEDRGLSLGFADALVTRLGNLPGIDVLPAHSVLSIPANTNPAEIASRLGVRFVIRGSIQIEEARSRVSLELFDSNLRRVCFARKYAVDSSKLLDLKNVIASQIARALNRPLAADPVQSPPRYSREPMAYSEFMQGFRLSSSGDSKLLQEAAKHLSNSVTRDPSFALAHAVLSYVCAILHFEFDPSWTWLEKAEFHCRRSLELAPDLPEGHVASAFLLWGPSRNFQHLEAIAELKRALALQSNLPHAYNRLGTILAHVGLLDHALSMYERGSAFDPRKSVSHSVVQVYMWKGEYDLARNQIELWRAENPSSKYAIYFSPQPAMFSGDWKRAKKLLEEAASIIPEDPMVVSLQGVFHALTGNSQQAMRCLNRACTNPKSFGHAHHTYYQAACIHSLLGRPEAAFEWLEKTVDTGFACWPLFLKDSCLQNVRLLPKCESLIGSLQAKYPDHLGILETGVS